MIPNVHKLLIHGPSVVKHFLITIGQLSEDVQESRHKEFRKFRSEYAMKISRVNVNFDILHNLLVSSDPLITFKQKMLDHDIKELLMTSDPTSTSSVA